MVVGVESIVGNRVSVWYTAEAFKLDDKAPTNITVSFTNMDTQDFNPINPEDYVSRYLYK